MVIATHFRPIERLNLVGIGAVGALLAERGFPQVEEQPPYDPPIERFDVGFAPPSISLELIGGVPRPRVWFLNDAGDELLQVQDNWFACNWRKVAPDAEYGRWEPRWNAFVKSYENVKRAVGLDDDAFDHQQVEVTYVNHIEIDRSIPEPGNLSHALSVLVPANDPRRSDFKIPPPERSDLRQSYRMLKDNEPVGRLHVAVASAFRLPGPQPIITMNLTARGRPLGAGLDGVRLFAELAHEWIVRSFPALTTEAMHTEWGRER